ncbi:MAG TPA: SIMPL domain-containing protein [Candidatus Nanoarchaeia archaeon]|nr:SIMPL domain-containing protein [Candidatus Nanoarchaeia archaeon]
MNNEKFLDKPFVLPALVLGLAFVLASIIGGYTFYKTRTLDDALSVTGSAKTSVKADNAKWSFNISRRTGELNLQTGYAALARDLVAVNKFLAQNNIKPEQINITPVFMEQMYYDSNYQGPREVTLRQNITVSSTDVAGITQLAKNTDVLTQAGIFFQGYSPEYYYSKLAELRVSLLSDAVKDAKARAEQIAKSSGQNVGALKAASSGVVQVLPPNSIEVADYGAYDTSSIDKDVMVTVRATFFVR